MKTPHHVCLTLALLMLAAPAASQQITQLALTTKDLAYDPVSNRIYASIPGNAAANGNSIAVINPVSQAVGPFIPVGSDPGKIAISDDGSWLYVGLDGAASVRRVNLRTLTPDIQFAVGNDPFFGPLYPEDLAVQPGNPDVVAVSTKRLGVSPRHGGVAVYQDGVMRPSMTPSHTGANVIEWSAFAATLYGYNNETTEFGFRQMLVDATGVRVTNTLRTSITGFGIDIHFHQGVVYATNGVAIDPQTGASLGTFPGTGFANGVVADAAADRVYFLSGRNVLAYQASNYTLVETIALPAGAGRTSSIVLWGPDSLACRTDSNQVFLVTKAPVRTMDISPRSGDYLASQNFDLVLLVTAPGTSITAIANATLDGNDITSHLRRRAIPGRLANGDTSLRIPSFGSADALGAGTHDLSVTVDLADGTSVMSRVGWNVLAVIE